MGGFFEDLFRNPLKTVGKIAGVAAPFIPGPWGVAAGALGGLVAADEAGDRANAALKQQRGIAEGQQGLFNQAMPYVPQTLRQLSELAGLNPSTAKFGLGPYVTRPGEAAIFNLPQQRAQFMTAEEDLARAFRRGANELTFRFNQQGIGGSTLAAALSQLERQREAELGDFRRNLAVQAPEIQQARTLQLLSSLGPLLGLGQNAASIYGAQGALRADQADAAGGGVADLLGNYAAYQQLQKERKKQGSGSTPSIATPNFNPNSNNALQRLGVEPLQLSPSYR